ncbi:MAG: pantoate--beta-alanine ligase [Candidatus Binatia bacterium]
MRTIVSISDMQRFSDAEHRQGHRVALVPTMGALHEGHLSLVRAARRRADTVVVSIFVNPIQFNSQRDFDLYPRDEARDSRLCQEEAVDVLFAPTAAEMYPSGFQTRVEVTEISKPLCGAHRPGHFAGVATVVSKLFLAVKPDIAIFGEKDFQQLQVVRRLVRDLNFDVEIGGGETVREADGLAMSSRNARLGAAAREQAGAIPRALDRVREAAAGGETDAARLQAEFAREVERHGGRVEYAELRDPESLEPVAILEGSALFAVAAWIGDVRLIDNTIIRSGEAVRIAAGGRSR